jgi:hypothetical protein
MNTEKEIILAMINEMEQPKFNMISTLLMGVLLETGLPQQELNSRIESILPDFDNLSRERPAPFSTAFTTNLFVWSLPNELKGGFFSGLDLSQVGLLKTVKQGVNDWHYMLSNNEINQSDLLQFYKDLSLILTKACAGHEASTETIQMLLSIPEKIITLLSENV